MLAMTTYSTSLMWIVYLCFIMFTNTKVFLCNDIRCQNQKEPVQCIESTCEIQCITELSCSGLDIQCPARGLCTVQCLAERSCEGITIHAESSKELQIKIGSAKNVIPKSHIYVPNTGTHSTTAIDCGDGASCNQMNIYSTYGIADINLSCKSKDCLSESYLYCNDKAGTSDTKDAYTISCPISCGMSSQISTMDSVSGCTCTDTKHVCNSLDTPKPTYRPTLLSVSPTKYPSNMPSKYPTSNPSANPTNIPTVSPVRDGEVYNDGGKTSNSDANNSGNDSMNSGQSGVMDTSILYALIAAMAVICVMVILFLVYRQKTRVKNAKMKLEMVVQKKRISSMSQASHMSDNEIINGMNCVTMTPNLNALPMLVDVSSMTPMTPNDLPMTHDILPITPSGNDNARLSVTPNGLLGTSDALPMTVNDTSMNEGQNEEGMEDMYENIIEKVTETGGFVTPRDDVCMQINEDNEVMEDLNVVNASDSNLLNESDEESEDRNRKEEEELSLDI